MKTRKRLDVMLLSMVLVLLSVPVMAEAGSTPVRLYPTEIRASSTLPTSSYGTYVASNVDDGDVSTAWVEGVSGEGIGEFLDFSFPAGTVVTSGLIFSGYYKSDDLFFKNGAPIEIGVQSGSARETIAIYEAGSSFDYTYTGQVFYLTEPIVCDGTVRVSIDGVRAGSKYMDTCISELYLYGYAPGTAPSAAAEGGSMSATDGSESGGMSEAGAMSESGTASEAGAIVDPARIQIQTDGLPYVLGANGKSYAAQDILSVYQTYEWEDTYRWSGFATQLAWRNLPYNTPAPLQIASEAVPGEAQGFLLYWYLYHYHDSRATPSSDDMYTSLPKEMAPTLIAEMFGTAAPGSEESFSSLVPQTDAAGNYLVQTYGDFGDAGSWRLGKISEIQLSNGRLRMSGTVEVENWISGAELSDGDPYAVYFRFNGREPLLGLQFDELAISAASIEAADQRGAELYRKMIGE